MLDLTEERMAAAVAATVAGILEPEKSEIGMPISINKRN